MNSTSQLNLYLENAFKQCEYLKLNKYDKAFQAKGGKIIYAIDNSIIHLHTQPLSRSKSKKGETHRGVGDVFPRPESFDSDDMSLIITKYLSDYLFKDLDTKTPFLLLNQACQDHINYYNSLVNGINKEKFETNKNFDSQVKKFKEKGKRYKKIKKLKGKTKAQKQKLAKLKQELISTLKKLVEEYLKIDSNLEQFNRLSKLIKKKKVLAGSVFSKKYLSATDYEKRIGNYISESLKLPDLFKKSFYQKEWGEIVKEIYEKTELDYKDDRDADTLSRIQLINQNIGPNFRLVLITNSSTIIKSAENKNISELEGIVLDTDKEKYQNFADLYIRSPRQFIGTMYDFMLDNQPKQNVRQSFKEWLYSFLSDFEFDNDMTLQDFRDGKQLKKSLDNLYNRDDHDKLLLEKDIYSQWLKFNQEYSVEHLARLKSKNLKNSALKYYDGLNAKAINLGIVKGLKKDINKRVDKAWKEFEDVGLDGGYWLVENRIVRLPPPIYFTIFPELQKKIFEIIKQEQKIDYEVIKNIANIIAKESDGNEATYQYLRYTVFSLLFTVARHAGVAIHLAKEACDINLPENSNISKREAKFLIAYNYRVSSQNNNNNELNSANKFLNKSLLMLQNSEIEGEIDRQILTVRHDAEKLSLELAKHMRYIFKCAVGIEEKHLVSLKACTEAAKNIALFKYKDDSVVYSELNEAQKIIYNILVISACCDFYTIQVALYHKSKECDNKKYHKISASKDMRNCFYKAKTVLKDKGFYITKFVKIMYEFSTVVNGEKASHEFYNQLKKMEHAKKPSTPYDRERYQTINEICKELAQA